MTSQERMALGIPASFAAMLQLSQYYKRVRTFWSLRKVQVNGKKEAITCTPIINLTLKSEVPLLVVSNHWTGLLDWNTGMDYWTDIFIITIIIIFTTREGILATRCQ